MLKRFLILGFLILVPVAKAAPRTTCGFEPSGGYDIRWCYEAGGALSTKVIYYFHGIGGNEKNWEKSKLHDALDRESAGHPELRPHVYAISFGRAWFLTDEAGRSRDSRLSAFLSALPKFEARLPKQVVERIGLGESMGGYNVLRLMQEVPTHFRQVFALCPALLPIGPYSSEEEIEAFKERNREYLNVQRLELIRYWVVTEFPNQESWIRNNPLDRSAFPIPFLPPIYLAQDLRDEFGFPEGTSLFASRLSAQGHTLTLRTEDVAHCKHTPELLKEVAGLVMTTGSN